MKDYFKRTEFDNDFLPGFQAEFRKSGLSLDCGRVIDPVKVAYTVQGKLNRKRNNAILVCHALTGDQYVAEEHPLTQRPGWWSNVVGPGRPIDTSRFYVICSNVLGGCMGTTGPCSEDPDTGLRWGFIFPTITIPDMVRLQVMLLDHLRIERLLCVVGGSMGGMQVLEWGTRYGARVYAAIAIATSYRQSPQNIALDQVGRQAIVSDPDWYHGRYFDYASFPSRGLAIARMLGHITYLSEERIEKKFGRRPQASNDISFGFSEVFQVESYLKHQGDSFIKRFDANSYLYITRATDFFDLAHTYGGFLANAFAETATKFRVFSFSSDWLYPPSESQYMVNAMQQAGTDVLHSPLPSENGHDAFLLDEPDFHSVLRDTINALAFELDVV